MSGMSGNLHIRTGLFTAGVLLTIGCGAFPGSLMAQNIVQSCQADVSIKSAMQVPLTKSSAGHLLVGAEIGIISSPAIIDTGALGIGGVISGGLVDRLEATGSSGPKLTVHGAHGGGAMDSRILAVTVENGPASADQLFIVAEDFPVDEADMILGSRFLCQFQVEFNLADSKMTFMPREFSMATGDEWTAIEFDDVLDSGGVRFDMLLGSARIPAVLDTGSPFTAINWAAAAEIEVHPDSAGVTEVEFPAHGLLGTEPVVAGVFRTAVALPGNQRSEADLELRISDVPVFRTLLGDGPGMILGLDFFEGKKFRIDYANKRLYFSP